MHNVVIADDEHIIRNGMKKYIPWKDEGFNLVGTAANGQIALELIKNNKVDILITDIKMPIMDGIELLREIEILGLDIIIIFISAYDDFQYAKEAIKSKKVHDYILKPFVFDEFIEMLRDTIKFIDNGPENSRVEGNSYDEYSMLMRTCLNIVNSRYMDSSFSLSNLAEELYISTNYLSSYFKKEMGIGFSKYLQDLRIKKAKELLLDIRLKTYEISNAVGFVDSRYFSRIFREIEGMTPTEYRECCGMIKRRGMED